MRSQKHMSTLGLQRLDRKIPEASKIATNTADTRVRPDAFLKSNILSWPWRPGSRDRVTATLALHHCPRTSHNERGWSPKSPNEDIVPNFATRSAPQRASAAPRQRLMAVLTFSARASWKTRLVSAIFISSGMLKCSPSRFQMSCGGSTDGLGVLLVQALHSAVDSNP